MKFQPKLFVTIPYIKLGYATTKLPIFVVLAVAVGVDVVAGVVVAVGVDVVAGVVVAVVVVETFRELALPLQPQETRPVIKFC